MLLSKRVTGWLTRVSARVVYGTVVLAAVVGSLSDPLPSNGIVMLSVVVSLLSVCLARTLAYTIRRDMESRSRTPWSGRLEIFRDSALMMASTIVPIFFFGLAMAGAISQGSALLATRAVLLAVLLAFGFISRRLSGASVPASIVTGLIAFLLGFLVIQVKLLGKYLAKLGE